MLLLSSFLNNTSYFAVFRWERGLAGSDNWIILTPVTAICSAVIQQDENYWYVCQV